MVYMIFAGFVEFPMNSAWISIQHWSTSLLPGFYYIFTQEPQNFVVQQMTPPKETSEGQSTKPSSLNEKSNENTVKRTAIELTEELRARIEANRLKALERAKARALAAHSQSWNGYWVVYKYTLPFRQASTLTFGTLASFLRIPWYLFGAI
jgi:hypothetical protein